VGTFRELIVLSAYKEHRECSVSVCALAYIIYIIPYRLRRNLMLKSIYVVR